MTEIVPAVAAQIERAAALLGQGQVVAFPTESSYGLAVDASDCRAVDRLLSVKGRAARQKISVLAADQRMLAGLAPSIPAAARRLIDLHWPGPLTLVLPAGAGLPGALVNERGNIGVRISSDPVAGRLVELLGRPITATSANRSGEPAATRAADAALPGVKLVLDDGSRCESASTVVEIGFDGSLRVLRPGPIAVR